MKMKTTVTIFVGLSILLNAKFIRNDSKDIVIDTKTGLQWQDNSHPTAKYGNAVNYCYNLIHGGYSDWRLPNINEYITLTDYTNHNPTVSREFAYIYSDTYYISSTFYRNKDDIWMYNSGSGTVTVRDIYHFNSYNFFCVRG